MTTSLREATFITMSNINDQSKLIGVLKLLQNKFSSSKRSVYNPCKIGFFQCNGQTDSLIHDAFCLCKINLGQKHLFLFKTSSKGVVTSQRSDSENDHVILILSDFGNCKENQLPNRLFISLSLSTFHYFQDFFFLEKISFVTGSINGISSHSCCEHRHFQHFPLFSADSFWQLEHPCLLFSITRLQKF